jgi:hypothetical protein
VTKARRKKAQFQAMGHIGSSVPPPPDDPGQVTDSCGTVVSRPVDYRAVALDESEPAEHVVRRNQSVGQGRAVALD